MSFDISKITSAINEYLYSISDTSKLLSESSETSASSGLAGIFQKYLEKAISDKKMAASEDASVTKAMSDLSGIIGGTETDENSTSDLMASVLPDLVSGVSVVSSSKTASGSTSSGVDQVTKAVNRGLVIDSLASEIKNAFGSVDIQGEIQKSIASHNRISEISTYNASRINSYKKHVSDTSVFGDFKL
ncbi:hypothetical protein [Butyrivibrio sp. YAB3001]|uniref:hypothetical protein n=1 Tax=Butyrivibrio sp. YAB3001 TaxID=1520812 RepID=UPI0008F6832C|nr:hypothetical protein [Butyrivibrio sp. YAB3001]SFB83751.1 hypothetical protein SAMN02910398_00814 [Butyrivibrio sp. YAB3001]